MNRVRDLKHLVLGATLAASGLSAIAAVNLTTFSPGTPIKSSEVNANFSSLRANIEALQAPGGVGGAQLAAGSVDKTKLAASGTAADGKVLKLQGGNLVWGDDLVGSGGSTYSADGSSLSLTGTTFSVSDGGIGTIKIADNAVTSAKLAPNSVGFGRIADGSIPVSKFQMPLSLSGGFGNQPIVKAVDSGGNGFGLWGESAASIGVYGKSGSGVTGVGASSAGVIGNSAGGIGVLGLSTSNVGVYGLSSTNFGVYGQSSTNNAVYGVTAGTDTNATAIAGTSGSGYAAYFEASSAVCKFHAGTTNWACSSDKNLKEHFQPVNPDQVLEAVSKMPVTTWSMKGSSIRQMGPTAQDFHAAFRLGDSYKSINNTDAQGVAFAAIQGLNRKLEAENTALKAALGKLEARLKVLEQKAGK